MEIDEWRCPVCERRDIYLKEIESEHRSRAGLLLKWFGKGSKNG